MGQIHFLGGPFLRHPLMITGPRIDLILSQLGRGTFIFLPQKPKYLGIKVLDIIEVYQIIPGLHWLCLRLKVHNGIYCGIELCVCTHTNVIFHILVHIFQTKAGVVEIFHGVITRNIYYPENIALGCGNCNKLIISL